jgi:hypothetical protein
MHLHEVENPIVELVKYANLHGMEEVGLRKVVLNMGNMLIHVESLDQHVAMRVQHQLHWRWHRCAFYIGCDPAGGVPR